MTSLGDTVDLEAELKRLQDARVGQAEMLDRLQQLEEEVERHERMEREVEAAIVIQRTWKGSEARGTLSQQHLAAIRVQCVWRGFLGRRRVAALRAEPQQQEQTEDLHPEVGGQPDTTGNPTTSHPASRGSVVGEGDSTTGGAPRKQSRGKRRQPSAQQQVEELMATCHDLEERGHPVEALENHWKLLRILQQWLGEQDNQTEAQVLKIAELQNQVAQDLIQRSMLTEANKYLQSTDKLLVEPLSDPKRENRRLVVRAHMYNTITCVYKGQGNIRGALKNTEKALSILLDLNMIDQLPTCYLNVCALYSALGLHAEALQHAFLALQVVKELIRLTSKEQATALNLTPTAASPVSTVSPTTSTTTTTAPRVPLTVEDQLLPTDDPLTRLSNLETQLAITYFNIAVEQEYLNDFPACINTYQTAHLTAADFLGADHPLTKRFRNMHRKVLREERRAQEESSQPHAGESPTRGGGGGIATTASISSVYAKQLRQRKGLPPGNPRRGRGAGHQGGRLPQPHRLPSLDQRASPSWATPTASSVRASEDRGGTSMGGASTPPPPGLSPKELYARSQSAEPTFPAPGPSGRRPLPLAGQAARGRGRPLAQGVY